jgi:hypothetical protein
MASGTEVAAHFQHQADTLNNLIDSHAAMKDKLGEADTYLASQLAAAQKELAAIYVPALTDEVFQRATQLTGFQGFLRRDPRLAMQQERKVLQSSLAQLDADSDFQRRDVLVGPAGTLQQELDASREALAPLDTECSRFESQVDFSELVEVGYDTPSFKEHWWNAGYWRHWAAGDRICKALGMNDFGDDVLPAYRKFQEPRDVMRADVMRLEQAIDRVHQIVQQHDQTADRLAHLDEIYLDSAQGFLGEHLGHADLALLEQWVANEPEARAVQQALRKLAGLDAKRTIIGEMRSQGIPGFVADLTVRRDKARQKAWKFQRPKYAYGAAPNSLINPQFDDKTAALAANQAKLQRRLDTMMAFDDYNRFNLANDSQMWWWYFFESPPNRYYTPSLFDYYQRRPDIRVIEDDVLLDDPGSVVGAALVGSDLEQTGYLS